MRESGFQREETRRDVQEREEAQKGGLQREEREKSVLRDVPHPPISFGFWIWVVAAAAVLTAVSKAAQPPTLLAGLSGSSAAGSVKNLCMALFLMADLLFLLTVFSDSFCWPRFGCRAETPAGGTKPSGRGSRLRLFLSCLAATALFSLYCHLDRILVRGGFQAYLRPSSYRDSLVASGIFAAGVLAGFSGRTGS